MPAHAVAPAEEARAEHVVRAAAGDGPEDPLEVARVVLAIPVEIDGGGVPLVTRGLEAAAQSGAKAARDRMGMNPRTVLARDGGGAIARAVVDEEHVDIEPAGTRRDAANDGTDGSLLVASNHNSKAPRKGLRHPRAGPRRGRFRRDCPA